MGRWPPDARDTNYRGPYPTQNLHQARGVLIRCLQESGDPVLQSLLQKIGIDLANGCVIPSPLPPIARGSTPLPIINDHPMPDFSGRTPEWGALPVRHVTPPMRTPRRPFLLEPPEPRLLFAPTNPPLRGRPREPTPTNFAGDNDHFMFEAGDFNVRMDSPMGKAYRFSEFRNHEEMQSNYSNFSAIGDETDQTFDRNNRNLVKKASVGEDSSVTRGNDCVAVIRNLHEVNISNETLKQILANKSSTDEDISSIRGPNYTSTIHSVADVDISSETLKQILACVGQTYENHVEPQCSRLSQTFVDKKDEVSGQNHDSASRSSDINCHDVIQGETGSNREDGVASSSETCKSNTSENKKSNVEMQLNRSAELGGNSNSETQRIHINNGEQTLTEHLVPVFKCDHCRFTTQRLNDMRLHLADSNHPSGSEYVAKQVEPCRSELLYTERMMAVKNPTQTRKSNTVIACPECRETFDDIFICSQHFKYEHKSVNGYHVICPVIHHQFIPLSLSPDCSTCHDRFTSWQALCDHWCAFPDHSPLPPSFNHQIFHQFVCPTCGCTFSENFSNAVVHLLSHFQDEHRSEVDCKTELPRIEMKQVMLPMRKEIQHDFNPHLASNGIKDEIRVLKKLCSSGKLTSGLLAAEVRINELQCQLSTS